MLSSNIVLLGMCIALFVLIFTYKPWRGYVDDYMVDNLVNVKETSVYNTENIYFASVNDYNFAASTLYETMVNLAPSAFIPANVYLPSSLALNNEIDTNYFTCVIANYSGNSVTIKKKTGDSYLFTAGSATSFSQTIANNEVFVFTFYFGGVNSISSASQYSNVFVESVKLK